MGRSRLEGSATLNGIRQPIWALPVRGPIHCQVVRRMSAWKDAHAERGVQTPHPPSNPILPNWLHAPTCGRPHDQGGHNHNEERGGLDGGDARLPGRVAAWEVHHQAVCDGAPQPHRPEHELQVAGHAVLQACVGGEGGP